jgi:hypothetical protein
LLAERCHRFPVRNLEEKVKVVRHQAVSHHPDPGEGLMVAEDLAKDLLIAWLKDHPPVNDSGNNMIKRTALAKESGGPHGKVSV